jgi:hypothetical protein
VSLPPCQPQIASLDFDRPQLLVVVDTEEEFDWAQPFDRSRTSTVSIPAQDRAHAIYDRYGVVPTYVMDHPVATSPVAARYLRRLVDAGRADFGTHCHPWVTPPHDEAVNNFNSFHGNLPPELEAAKIRASTEAVAQAFGAAPRSFKAGRYGLGPKTFDTLVELGYTVDCSFVPHTRFSAISGPDFYGTPEQPFFTDATQRLLEVPLTVGYSGALNAFGRKVNGFVDAPLAQGLRLPGILSRMGLMERARLSPEGFDAATQCRLLRAMVAQGQRVFTMTYHSPSLSPGHTPYVPDEAALGVFLRCIETVLGYFQSELGGVFTTLAKVDDRARQAALQPAQTLAA